MSSTVFILGAGASKEAGAPLMNNFLDVAFRLYKTERIQDPADHFKRVFSGISALQAVHSKSELDFDNIESVFSTFEMAKLLNRFPKNSSDSMDDLIHSLKFLIATTLEHTLRFPVDKDGVVQFALPYREFYDLLRMLREKASPRHTISILTFNYDIAIDHCLSVSGQELDYCLTTPSGEKTKLLKLHGSLNWGFRKSDNKVVVYEIKKLLRDFRYNKEILKQNGTKAISISVSSKIGELTNDSSGSVLVPPTWNKSEYHNTLDRVWSQAATELSEAENIFIIGYSLPETDAFFRYLFALGTVGDTLLRKIWVFNPDETVEKRFFEMLGPGAKKRFQFFKKGFSDAINVILREFSSEK